MSSENATSSSQLQPSRTIYYVDAASLNIALVLASPPSETSVVTRNELNDLHRIEHDRTPEQVAIAQADDQEQDIFIFRDVLGKNFTAKNLPLTAALSEHIHNDESVASAPLKTSYSRLRPFQLDTTLHPVCKLTKEPNSYPSGHALSGYLLAFTLARLVPEKREQILKRADEYAYNRLICGVHYASDIEASRRMAAVMFGAMLENIRFQKDIADANAEIHSHLQLSAGL